MSTVTVTASSVVPGANAVLARGTAGAAITAGQPVYADPANSTIKPADATSLNNAAAIGIALENVAINQPVVYATSGDITYGAGLNIGESYLVSSTAGAIVNALTDLVTGRFPTLLGIGISTSVMRLAITPTNVAK